MKLFYRKLGAGKPLIILHGLFGMSDNWQTLGKRFAEQFEVNLVDLRNHGKSPHSVDFNYKSMASDILELMDDNGLNSASIIGHSMGGKVAMTVALDKPDRVEKFIAVDISPKEYPVVFKTIVEVLESIDLDKYTTKREVEAELKRYIEDDAVVQLYQKNLYYLEKEKLAWKFNLSSISKNLKHIHGANVSTVIFNKPALFLRGAKSLYVKSSDLISIKDNFPLAQMKVVSNAGHWVHADNPDEFFEYASDFLQNRS